MNSDVHLALVEFGRQREGPALRTLIPTLRRVYPSSALHVVVVDNSDAADVEVEIDSDLHLIGGDNTMREFSGWDRAIAWLQQRYTPAAGSIVVLANDTVARPDKRTRVGELPADRAAAAASGALVGWIDEYPRQIELFGLGLRQWVDTSLVITQWRTVAALGPLARLPRNEVFSTDWRAPFLEPSPLSENYRAYLKTYFCGDPGIDAFDHRWYAQEPISALNFEAFKLKLRCVFCEHLLSARSRALGIPLVDIRPRPLAIDPPVTDAVAP
jgi:hypothetical protein